MGFPHRERECVERYGGLSSDQKKKNINNFVCPFFGLFCFIRVCIDDGHTSSSSSSLTPSFSALQLLGLDRIHPESSTTLNCGRIRGVNDHGARSKGAFVEIYGLYVVISFVSLSFDDLAAHMALNFNFCMILC
jgi:hypothetical protein